MNAALSSLLSIKRLNKESAAELEKLYTHIMEIYRTLDNLHCPVSTWDDFLVFLTVQKLDSETVKAWEQHLGASKELPTWAQLQEFLVSRLLSLQAYEKSRHVKSNPNLSAPVKSHYQGKWSTGGPAIQKPCPLCCKMHAIWTCPQYTDKTSQQRVGLVKKYRLCYNCLGAHRVQQCKSTRRCQNCAAKHHTTIHRAHQQNTKGKPDSGDSAESAAKQPEKQVLHSCLDQTVNTSSVLLATAWIKIITPTDSTYRARVLLDQGSEVSLITERLVQRLRLPRGHSHLPLIGIGAQKSVQAKGSTSITFTSHFESDFKCTCYPHILPKLTTSIPSGVIESRTWRHLENLQLADPGFNNPTPIDVILGADVYGQLIEEGMVKGLIDTPIAQQTKLGWIISGPTNSSATSTVAHGFHVTSHEDLYDLLRRFWILEEPPSVGNKNLSADEQNCEDLFRSTHSRDKEGRYVIKLPFKHSISLLGDSHMKATQAVKRLFRQFKDNPNYAQRYLDFMKEYEVLEHMHLVTAERSTLTDVYYLPHHGVWKEHSTTTKLRVVFNGSSPTTSGYSLNDILHTGAKLQTEIFDVLCWFRKFQYVFSTDVEKMFRQIKVHQDHWAFQRVLWLDPVKGPLIFELSTVTYGLVCAPYIALRVFQQLVEDEGSKYPLAVSILTKGRYVDDIFGGADSIEEAHACMNHLDRLCTAGGFSLKKWMSNEPSVLQHIPVENQISGGTIEIDKNMVIHTLGLSWQPNSDTFSFTTKITVTEVTTKRIILSNVAKLFDPLGFLSPIIITAKILIQELWSIKLGWDDPLPKQMTEKWHQFVYNLQSLDMIAIPRWLNYKADYDIELHGFCDASQQTIAATVYMRSNNKQGEITVRLVAAKTKVAPLKRLTIPRLELSGAHLLTKLVLQLATTLEMRDAPIYMWTDSSITLT